MHQTKDCEESRVKEKLKAAFPVLYKAWHKMRIKRNERAEKAKKKAYDDFGLEILGDLYSMVYEKNYDVSCYYGTLLGLVRDNKLIPWDDDLDFIILNTPSFTWDQFQRDMNGAGFRLYRTIENETGVIAQSYKKKGVLCDFGLKDTGNQTVESLYGCYEIPGVKYDGKEFSPYRFWVYNVPQIPSLESKKLSGIQVKIPQNYKEILEAYYGKNWGTPDPNFKPDRIPTEVMLRVVYK